MSFNNARKSLGLLLLAAAFFGGCDTAVTRSGDVSEVAARRAPTPPDQVLFVEPVATPLDKYSDGLRESWRRLTANGQYRLAQFSDRRFPESAAADIASNVTGNPLPFVYVWGDLNFKKRVADDHLAAIIVDTAKTDANRFSLVIFSPPEGKTDAYETHWLYRDRDLSKTTVNRASGEFYITEHRADGTRQTCSVNWNRQQKRFVCQ